MKPRYSYRRFVRTPMVRTIYRSLATTERDINCNITSSVNPNYADGATLGLVSPRAGGIFYVNPVGV